MNEGILVKSTAKWNMMTETIFQPLIILLGMSAKGFDTDNQGTVYLKFIINKDTLIVPYVRGSWKK